MSRNSPRTIAKSNIKKRLKRQRFKDLGLCTCCGAEREPGKLTCSKHLAQSRAAEARWVNRHRARTIEEIYGRQEQRQE